MRSIGLPSWIERLIGTAPQAVPAHAVAVEPERLAYAAFRRTPAGFTLRETRSVALPHGLFGDGPLGQPVGDPGALAGAVEALVSHLAHRPRRLSLVLPDAWAHGLVVELGVLPERADLRREVLRFRLKKLVPYRVEELRIAASRITPVEGQEDPVRALVLFAAEAVCDALERAFAERGLRFGQITNRTLARLEALAHGGRLPGLTALAAVDAAGFTLVFARDGEPLLWRQKAFTAGLDDADRAPLLAAELRLTRTFLGERLGGSKLDGVMLAAPEPVRPFWTGILEDGLDHPVAALEPALLPLAGELPSPTLGDLAALVGAACREVA